MNSNDKYEVTPNEGGRGFQFENKLVALISLRLYNRPGEFYLASNCKKAGKFDDIVFAAQFDGAWQSCFMQLKHKQLDKKITLGNLMGKHHDFSIQQYFESYKTVAQKFAFARADPIFSHKFLDSLFVLFTNAAFDEDVTRRKYDQQDIGFLSTNPGKEVNIKLNLDKDSDLVGKLKDDFIGEFFKQFMICTKQSYEGLEELIKVELKKMAPLPDKDIELLCHRWIKHIHQWAPSGNYLKREDVASVISKLRPQTSTVEVKPIVKFNNVFISNMVNQVARYGIHLYEVCGAETMPFCVAALQQAGLNTDPNACMLVENLNPETIDNFIRLKTCQPRNRIILVFLKGNTLVKSVKPLVNLKAIKFECSLADFSPDSKEMMLNKKFTFQGYDTTLRAILIVPTLFNKVPSAPLLAQIMSGKPLANGLNVNINPIYVERFLHRQDMVSTSFLNNPLFTVDLIAISGLCFQELVKLFPRISVLDFSCLTYPLVRNYPKTFIVIRSKSDFDLLVEKIQHPIHWFKKDVGFFWKWVGSSKNAHILPRMLNPKMLSTVPTKDIFKIEDKMVLVTSEPGMGKSAMLNQLAADTKLKYPHIWVIRVNLRDKIDHLKAPDFLKNVYIRSKQLIASAAEVSCGSRPLFDHCYSTFGNMVILVDGFDEILPDYQEEGLGLLKALKKSAVSRVWVTGRPVVRKMMEKTCSTISYILKPFNEKEQSDYVMKYFNQERKDNEMIKIFAREVFELCKVLIDEEFSMSPLHTFMIAKFCKEKYKDFQKTEKQTVTRKICLLQLFEEIIEKKWQLYCEKSNVKAMPRSEQKKHLEEWLKRMFKFSLVSLLPETQFTTLLPALTPAERHKLKQMVLNGNEDIGIVTSYSGETPVFVHKAFAEYFLGRFLEASKDQPAVKKYLEEALFAPELPFTRFVLNYSLAKNLNGHQMLLDQDFERIAELTLNAETLEQEDLGGRTMLHLAAGLPGTEKVIHQLLEEGAKINTKDALLSWRPLDYALKAKELENIAILQNANVKPTQVLPWTRLQEAIKKDQVKVIQDYKRLVQKNVNGVEQFEKLSKRKWRSDKEESDLNVLHVAAAFNAIEILKHLLDPGSEDCKKIIDEKNGDGHTPLLVAASSGSAEALKVLLNAGADVRIKDRKNQSFLELCAKESHAETFEVSVKFVAENHRSFLDYAAFSLLRDTSEWSCKQLLLLLGLKPEIIHVKKPYPLLCVAARRGNVPAMKILINKGVSVNCGTNLGSPLHFAVEAQQKNAVEFLLTNKKTKVDAIDIKGATPLYKAAQKGNFEIFLLLVHAGASLNVKRRDLAEAASHHPDILQYLTERGVGGNPNVGVNVKTKTRSTTVANPPEVNRPSTSGLQNKEDTKMLASLSNLSIVSMESEERRKRTSSKRGRGGFQQGGNQHKSSGNLSELKQSFKATKNLRGRGGKSYQTERNYPSAFADSESNATKYNRSVSTPVSKENVISSTNEKGSPVLQAQHGETDRAERPAGTEESKELTSTATIPTVERTVKEQQWEEFAKQCDQLGIAKTNPSGKKTPDKNRKKSSTVSNQHQTEQKLTQEKVCGEDRNEHDTTAAEGKTSNKELHNVADSKVDEIPRSTQTVTLSKIEKHEINKEVESFFKKFEGLAIAKPEEAKEEMNTAATRAQEQQIPSKLLPEEVTVTVPKAIEREVTEFFKKCERLGRGVAETATEALQEQMQLSAGSTSPQIKKNIGKEKDKCVIS